MKKGYQQLSRWWWLWVVERKQEVAAVIPTHVMQHNEELIFREAVGIGRLLQDGVEAPAGTVLHHQNLVSGVGLQQQGRQEEKRKKQARN